VIGVIVKAGQTAAVEEFFELFKTPWEFYRPGRTYDVVVTTVDEIPDVEARLLVVYGAGVKARDGRDGIVARSRRQGESLSYRGSQLPIYDEIVTFEVPAGAVSCVAAGDEAAGLRISKADLIVMRVGYDLFREVELLLSAGQPPEQASVPTLDLHIMMLREWILSAGITLVEIPPAPAGHEFIVCLTHDIDFAGIRNHRFDHTMWGFLYRSTIGAAGNLVRGRLSIARLFQSWRAAASLPFVYLGWAKDFWEPFGWYLHVERNLPATYFLIPFKGRPGEKVAGPHTSRRGAGYDVAELAHWTAALLKQGVELGVHGIDAWHSVEKGREESARISAISGESRPGIRMHWLLRDEGTFRVLEDAGYAYDSTVGYNETVGYRSGTAQVFRPLGARSLLELPLQIQDGALFFPNRLDLPEPDAWERCGRLIDHVRAFGGVLTVLWHDRSHGPERFWGDFYVRLVQALRSLDGWFGTAGQVVGWFRQRREVRFERLDGADGTARIRLHYHGEDIRPPVTVRVHRPGATFADVAWNGGADLDVESVARPAVHATVGEFLR
jgi:hypothetical protein